MKELIGCCGLDCEKCNAFIFTVNNNYCLRDKNAKLWSKLNNIPITPEMINCTGCLKTFFVAVFVKSVNAYMVKNSKLAHNVNK